jgi:hypothetical protein
MRDKILRDWEKQEQLSTAIGKYRTLKLVKIVQDFRSQYSDISESIERDAIAQARGRRPDDPIHQQFIDIWEQQLDHEVEEGS